MNHSVLSKPMLPVTAAERHVALDVLRGAALLGVLLVNLHSGFRVSLFTHILSFHTHAGWANHATDILLAWHVEFKAFTLFSFLFGVGVGVQAERAATTQASARSVSWLAALPYCSSSASAICCLFWNGDILTLYAVCGLLLIPFITMSARRLACVGSCGHWLSPLFAVLRQPFPDRNRNARSCRRRHARLCNRELRGNHGAALQRGGAFHRAAADQFPAANFWLDAAGHRRLAQRRPATTGGAAQTVARHSRCRRSLGALTTTLEVWSKETGQPPPGALDWLYPYSTRVAGLCLRRRSVALAEFCASRHSLDGCRACLPPRGRMALSNYLAQSVIFSLVFYGFGFGLFGTAWLGARGVARPGGLCRVNSSPVSGGFGVFTLARRNGSGAR